MVETTQKTLVVGGGVAGLRAAIGLADIGLGVFLVEREADARRLGRPVRRDVPDRQERPGADRRADRRRSAARPSITVFTEAEIDQQVGQLRQLRGRHPRGRRRRRDADRRRSARSSSRPASTPTSRRSGEYGYGIDGVVTLPEFKAAHRRRRRARSTTTASPCGRVAYVYCVGSREPADKPGRATRTARATAAPPPSPRRSSSRRATPQVHQYHLYRDMRTYGKFELMYTESRKLGSVYLKFADDAPPAVARDDVRAARRDGPRPARPAARSWPSRPTSSCS